MSIWSSCRVSPKLGSGVQAHVSVGQACRAVWPSLLLPFWRGDGPLELLFMCLCNCICEFKTRHQGRPRSWPELRAMWCPCLHGDASGPGTLSTGRTFFFVTQGPS